MRRPERLWTQYEGKAFAETIRGSGRWHLQPHPCGLEPPWNSFDARSVSVWDCLVNDWEGPWEGSWFRRTFSQDKPLHPYGEPLVLPEEPCCEHHELAQIVVQQYPEDQTTIPKAQQFLLSLPSLRQPVAFEVFAMGSEPEWDKDQFLEIMHARERGEDRSYDEAISEWTKPYTLTRFVAHGEDAPGLRSQLIAHYPNSAVVIEDLSEHDIPGNGLHNEGTCGAILFLRKAYCQPLRTFGRLDPDPLGVILAAMDHLDKKEWAMLQVLFQPATHPWAETLPEAVADPIKPNEYILGDINDRAMREKFSTPLFAVSVRILASNASVFSQLEGWGEQFSAPPQRLCFEKEDWKDGTMPDDDRSSLDKSVRLRSTHDPGILLNLDELASLVHLPSQSIVSDRLRCVKSRTRQAPETKTNSGSVILGDNTHRGEDRVARISADLRSRHCYLAGASGTGKSTLLLNMILQDIQAGHGVGLLDPHGDLVKAVLARIPEDRVDDVILFDPADEQYPFALNILEAKGENERERIVAETVMALERYFPSAWGPRLERILTYTIHTVLQAIPGATLADVERMLTDKDFRNEVVAKTDDPRFSDFWTKQFIHLPKNASDPVLNKLSVFLLSRTVRNIICQRRSAVDFDSVINGRKIFLANLSSGLLTEKIAGMFGSFLVTKIVNAAFRRAAMPEQDRLPWYLYVDEFQSFMNLSVGFERILAEARKYNLVLAGLANQYVAQLSPSVRQAIFGNVGSLLVFRLGMDDANTVAREMGVFTAEEILNLELGQAIARTGGSSTAFNIQTYPPPPEGDANNADRILALTRERYANPRDQVEAELNGSNGSDDKPPPEQEPPDDDPPSDPSEDDLTS